MQIAVYDITAGQFIRSLNALKNVLEKANEFAEKKRLQPDVLLNSRLAPDQFPLSRQIVLTCEHAKGCCEKLTGVEAPKQESKEQSLSDFITRIDGAVEYLSSLTPEQFANWADKEVRFPFNPRVYLVGKDYLPQFALPNFFFHLTLAYSILRHNGVELGKRDYLGVVDWQE